MAAALMVTTQTAHADLPPVGASPAPLKDGQPPLAIELGGYIWYALPLKPGTPHKLELFFAYAALEAEHGGFGFRLEPRFRDTRLRDYFPSNIWVQEAYAFARLPADTTFKVGKVYSRLGMFWDGTFANLQYFDGLKLSPDLGLALESSPRLSRSLRLTSAVQYFVIDGTTNGSLTGRDTVSIAGAHKRNEVVVRVEPELALSRESTFAFGASGQVFSADFNNAAPKSTVARLAVETTLRLGPLSARGEYVRQRGKSVVALPQPTGQSPAAPFESAFVEYGLGVIAFTHGKLTLRAAMSHAHYADRGATEWLWHPGASYALDKYLSVIGEVVHWTREVNGSSSTVSDGVHVLVYAHY